MMRSLDKDLSSFPLWTALWSLALSLCWLAPNHYPPWAAFHAEAWCVLMMMFMVVGVFLRHRQPVYVPGFALALLGLAGLVWLQWAAGQFAFTGQAWLISGYFAAAGLVTIASPHWAKHAPNLPEDTLFAAIALAAFLSVGLQLDQWLRTYLLDIWSMGGDGTRPYANLGQPNLLSTFQIWGLMALLWWAHRGRIGIAVAVFGAVVLLFGIALTQSRTGWLCLAAVTAFVWWWRRLWHWPRFPVLVLALAVWLAVCVNALPLLSSAIGVANPPQLDGRLAVGGDLRFALWRMLFDASLLHPWFGYGIGNVFVSQVEVTTHTAPIHNPVGHAHNLVLDAAISVGWPLALVLLGALSLWLWRLLRRTSDPAQAILFMCVVVVGIHAMLELPLHHAHFLLPTCMFLSLLYARQTTFAGGVIIRAWWPTVGALAGIALVGLITVDYLRTEASLTRLRMEWNRVGREPPGGPPQVTVLNQFHAWISYLRYQPKQGETAGQLQWMRDVTMTIPAAAHFYILARTLALNDQPEEAAQRLRQMCDIFEQQKCEMIRAAWRDEALRSPEIARVPW